MAAIGDCILQGWLTKSPPEHKTIFGRALRFLSQKWRERYFILHKPSGSLPKEYALDYYRDHTIKRHVGRIDLEQCEEILSALDSAHYEHLFAVKTRHKQKERTYYLAAHTEREMNRWVECLCSVCGLADSETADAVLVREGNHNDQADNNAAAITTENLHSSALENTNNEQKDRPRNVQQGTTEDDDVSDIPTVVAPPVPRGRSSPSPYQELAQCRTGDASATQTLDKSASHDSLDSLPDVPPPPPPKDPIDATLDTVVRPVRDMTKDSGYASPPRHYTNRPTTSDFYDIPPPRMASPYDKVPRHAKKLSTSPRTEDWYDIPPSTHLQYSVSMRERPTQQMFTPSETYDYPRSQRNSADDDTYDIPPVPVCVNNNDLTKVVPPAGRGLIREYHYENLPTNSKSHPNNQLSPSVFSSSPPTLSHHPEPPPTTDDTYDVPPSHDQSRWRGGFTNSPPPPTPCQKIPHPYVNSPTAYISAPEGSEGPSENYIPMVQGSENANYIPMKINDSDSCQQYSPNVFQSSYQDDVYVSPRSNMPVHSSESNKKSQLAVPAEEADTYCIMPTQRTRSFKRKDVITRSQPQSVLGHIQLPHQRISESSSEDDDEDDILDKLSEVPEKKTSNIHACARLSSTPPPPRSGRGEIEYLDLDLKENVDSERSPANPRSPTGNTSPTDYKEIDFIKTKALSETRKDLENKRKSSDTG